MSPVPGPAQAEQVATRPDLHAAMPPVSRSARARQRPARGLETADYTSVGDSSSQTLRALTSNRRTALSLGGKCMTDGALAWGGGAREGEREDREDSLPSLPSVAVRVACSASA